MSGYKAIIVENDTAFVEYFLSILKSFPDITVLKTCADVDDAFESISLMSPDIVFIDIHLNQGTAFDLLSKFDNYSFDIIFISAYEEYAIKAFEFSAIHYLLKPFGQEELEEVLKRLNSKYEKDVLIKNLLSNLSNESELDKKIALKTMDGLSLVKINDIQYCHSESNYTLFHLTDGNRLVVSCPIKKFEDLLSEHHFLRIHQSYIINLNQVSKVTKLDGGSVILLDGTTLPISRRKKDDLLIAINKLVVN